MEAISPSPDITPEPLRAASERVYYYDLDVARGVLMALGVILHTANIYGLGTDVGSGNADKSVFFSYLAEAIHLFRMPAFFMISGFLCVMSLQRKGSARVFSTRAKRLLIPFAATLLTFNIIEFYVAGSIANPQGFRLLSEHSIHEVLTTNALLLHLWFLVVLFFYVAASCAVFFVVEKLPDVSGLTKALIRRIDRVDLYLFAPVLAFTAFMPHALGTYFHQAIYDAELFGLRLFTIFEYAPYFIFGVILYFAPRNFGIQRRFSLWKISIASLLVLVTPILILSGEVSQDLLIYVDAVASWTAAIALFGLFSALSGSIRVLPKDFGDMTYTLYLSHHLLVLLLGVALVGVAAPRLLEFCMIVTAVSAAGWALHAYGVRRFRPLKLLMNGK